MRPIMLTRATSVTCSHRFQNALPMRNDAPRTLRASRVRATRSLAVMALCGGLLSTLSTGLGELGDSSPPERRNATPAPTEDRAKSYPELRAAMSYRIALSAHAGNDKLDREIQTAQSRVREAADPRPFLEQLGWLYVAKARASHDQGFYKLAEHCARALETADPKSAEAKLLRGHLLISFHRFAEAEAIGKALVEQRALPFDYGLLGDALMEQGRLPEAVAAYQRMVDLRPDAQSYSRVAYMRWLKGDVEGAIDVARMAARAASSLDPESASWSLTRLARYHFQAGSFNDAKVACDSALRLSPDYPPALLMQSRMLLDVGRVAEAAAPAQRAAEVNPLPEFQWGLADTLRAAGRADEAATVEAKLKQTGAQTDPRTFALFLATRGEQPELAVQLAQRELKDRADIFTHDALAWALGSAGRLSEAWPHMETALAEETVDARLYLHAGVLAAKLGRTAEAESWLNKARSIRRMLLPSEEQQIAEALAALAAPGAAPSTSPVESYTISKGEDHLAKASLANKNKEEKDQ
jgi:tetratricopeptide (TPR) repeat protein